MFSGFRLCCSSCSSLKTMLLLVAVDRVVSMNVFIVLVIKSCDKFLLTLYQCETLETFGMCRDQLGDIFVFQTQSQAYHHTESKLSPYKAMHTGDDISGMCCISQKVISVWSVSRNHAYIVHWLVDQQHVEKMT